MMGGAISTSEHIIWWIIQQNKWKENFSNEDLELKKEAKIRYLTTTKNKKIEERKKKKNWKTEKLNYFGTC